MSEQIFVATAGNDEARAHFMASVAQPVEPRLLELIPTDIAKNAIADDGATYAWGALPTSGNQDTYSDLQVGDSVLFVWGSRYHSRSRVLAKAILPEFAAALLGREEKKGETWELVYFLSAPELLAVSVSDVADYLSAAYFGFARIGTPKVSRVLADFGSVDAFLTQRLGLQPNALPLPPVIENREVREFQARKQITRERGGGVPPKRRPMPSKPPKRTSAETKGMDPEQRRVAIERRNTAHYYLVRMIADAAEVADIECFCTDYADAMTPGCIFEMKHLDNDEVDQVRAAIGQLYHYRFLHRTWDGFARPRLYAVFDKPIESELTQYLDEIHMGVVWAEDVQLQANSSVRSQIPWAFVVESDSERRERYLSTAEIVRMEPL